MFPARPFRTAAALISLCFAAVNAPHALAGQPVETEAPNILLVILDDVGVDQLEIYGYGGTFPAPTPNLEAVAEAGVRFTNAWAMPECSPSRAAIMTGRYPVRTGVTSAIIPNMLPQAQVSPYEITLPRVLRTAGYASAMSGKYHLGNENPSGFCSPATRGFDYFVGNMEAGPPSIDTQAGNGSFAEGTYNCGFVRGQETPFYIERGACYFSDGSCQNDRSGKQCLEAGGLLAPLHFCSAQPPDYLDFDAPNAYYAWPEVETLSSMAAPGGCPGGVGPGCAELACAADATEQPQMSREYMTTAQTDGGLDWWNALSGPRMLTVSYNAIHTPYQQPPTGNAFTLLNGLVCSGLTQLEILAQRFVANSMLEYADLEIGRLLESLGLATLDDAGVIDELRLEETNTMLVIVGDNGSFGPIVKEPFDRFNSKGTARETGVLTPLLIAGPLVGGAPGRTSEALVNVADLFHLFAEIAGVDPDEVVPRAHPLDSRPMLAHLADPVAAPSVREYNFTQIGGVDTIATPVRPDARLWPCVLFTSVVKEGGESKLSGGFCSDLIFESRNFCEDNGGFWLGPGSDLPNPNAADPATPGGAWNSCCEAIAGLSAAGSTVNETAVERFAVRDSRFKLIEDVYADCSAPVANPLIFPPYEHRSRVELFDLGDTFLDLSENELCATHDAEHPGEAQCRVDADACGNAPACLADEPVAAEAFERLRAELTSIQESAIACPGDGNLDKRVDQHDLDGVESFFGAGPSYFDMNRDGQTTEADRQIVLANLGTDCLGLCRRADLDRDGSITGDDARLLQEQFGPCNVDLAADPALCGADLNGDGVINRADLPLVQQARIEAGEDNVCPVPGETP